MQSDIINIWLKRDGGFTLQNKCTGMGGSNPYYSYQMSHSTTLLSHEQNHTTQITSFYKTSNQI